MKPKNLILMGVAVACGLVAAFFAANVPGGTRSGGDTVQVLVAANDLPPGTMITQPDKMFVYKPFLKGSEPQNAITDPEKLKGKMLARTVDAGQAVTDRDLNQSDTLFRTLPKGYRAMTVRANLVNATSGFMLPGSKVDMITTTQLIEDTRLSYTRIFLQDILVLAVNAHDAKPQDTNTIGNPVTVTIAVKPEDSEKVAWVTDKKEVMMTLRKPGDDTKVDTKGVTNPYGDELDKGKGGSDVKTTQVPVAKDDIAPGTEIDDFDKYFKVESFPSGLVAKAITNKDELKRINRFLGAGQFAVKGHIDPIAKTEVEEKFAQMVIQDGKLPPQVVTYKGGLSVTKPESGSQPKDDAPPDSGGKAKGNATEGK